MFTERAGTDNSRIYGVAGCGSPELVRSPAIPRGSLCRPVPFAPSDVEARGPASLRVSTSQPHSACPGAPALHPSVRAWPGRAFDVPWKWYPHAAGNRGAELTPWPEARVVPPSTLEPGAELPPPGDLSPHRPFCREGGLDLAPSPHLFAGAPPVQGRVGGGGGPYR